MNLTEGVDPTSPARFREHGGSLCFKGKGPKRHALDPAHGAAEAFTSTEVRIEPSAISDLLRPRAVDEAIAGTRASTASNVRVLAGGTDLIPSMRQKIFEPEHVLDLRGIAAMRGIRPQSDGG